ncbi:MAG TPA: hypothetical protein DER09_01180 [Prolixibacteraceae bacterium]|nr:hypothetical protein [Prolixibacteraceae bacterium]
METEESVVDNQSYIDYTYGTSESGKVKKEFHFINSDDYEVQSDVEFIYDNEQIAGKIFTDYKTSQPVVLQKDTFIYNGEKLLRQLQLLRETTTDGRLKVSKEYNYNYPQANTRTKVIRNQSGIVEDSIVYVYNGELVISEKHFTEKSSGGFNYEYNSSEKLVLVTDLNGIKLYENQYDENGLLSKTLIFKDGQLNTTITFERILKGATLSIKKYAQKAGAADKILSSVKVFEAGKLVELNEYATAACGANWWCTRYQYY